MNVRRAALAGLSIVGMAGLAYLLQPPQERPLPDGPSIMLASVLTAEIVEGLNRIRGPIDRLDPRMGRRKKEKPLEENGASSGEKGVMGW